MSSFATSQEQRRLLMTETCTNGQESAQGYFFATRHCLAYEWCVASLELLVVSTIHCVLLKPNSLLMVEPEPDVLSAVYILLRVHSPSNRLLRPDAIEARRPAVGA